MEKGISEYKERHLAFWKREDLKRPLLGFSVGIGSDSWSYWNHNSASIELMKLNEILPQNINPNEFLKDQVKYLEESEHVDDDIIRSAMPLASIPWMEAILGCRILSSGEHFTAEKIFDDPKLLLENKFNAENPWIQKYIEFIEVYKINFKDRFPVSQSILRGPSDLVNAILGVENTSIALLTDPTAVCTLLDYVTDSLERFIRYQNNFLPKFQDGYVIGQYEIWAPELGLRFQEDASVFYSPEHYYEFLYSLDARIAGLSNYSLLHLHSASLLLIDKFLEIGQIKAFQITKDPGGRSLYEMLPYLKLIQNADKPLILKGIFDADEIELMKKNLTTAGLCIQPVVGSISEAKELLYFYKSWN